MKATSATDKNVPNDEHHELGDHRVVRKNAVDETGATYRYYRCIKCGRE